MTNLRVYDPFSAEPFDNFFKGFLHPLNSDLAATEPKIKIDVDENDQAYQIKAEIPGVKKEDLHIDVDGGMVSIRAEIKNERDVKDNGRTLRSERYYGSATRQFRLAQDVDESHADAKYENGILHLTLPKKPGSKSKRLTVN